MTLDRVEPVTLALAGSEVLMGVPPRTGLLMMRRMALTRATKAVRIWTLEHRSVSRPSIWTGEGMDREARWAGRKAFSSSWR